MLQGCQSNVWGILGDLTARVTYGPITCYEVDYLVEGWVSMGTWLCQPKGQLWTKIMNTLQIIIHDSHQCIDDKLGEIWIVLKTWLYQTEGQLWLKMRIPCKKIRILINNFGEG